MSNKAGGSLIEDVIIPGFIILLLASFMLPVFYQARQKAHQSTCASNLKATGFALLSYLQDYDGKNPPLPKKTPDNTLGQAQGTATWRDVLVPYIDGGFRACPDRDIPSGWTSEQEAHPLASGYTYNGNLADAVWSSADDPKSRKPAAKTIAKTIANPALTVAVFDGRVGSLARTSPDMDSKDANGTEVSPAATRHRGGANYLFADGHVKWFKPDGLQTGDKSDGIHPGFGL